MALATESQIVCELEDVKAHDVVMDMVLTETRTIVAELETDAEK